MDQQGSRPPRSGRVPGAGRSHDLRPGHASTDTDEQDPPWAGPGIGPRWAGRRPGDGPEGAPSGPHGGDGDDGTAPGGPGGPTPAPRRSRAALARARRTRRTRVVWGGGIAVALAAAVGISALLTMGNHPRGRPQPDALVTTFQPGEFRSVPKACRAVTGRTLDKYLPGKRRTVVPHSLFGSAESLCDWSVDAPPMYRLLEVTVRAYAPSGLASGNGSATAAAGDAYQQAMQQKAHPPKKSQFPKATVTRLHGLGDSAFAALQKPSAGGDTTDLMTVVVRDRNVLVTIVFDGLARSRNGKYGPVSTAQLHAGAVAAARDVLDRLH